MPISRGHSLKIQGLDVGSPFLERFIADGVLHHAGFLVGGLFGDAEHFGEEREQQMVAVENRPSVFVASIGQGDVAVIWLVNKTFSFSALTALLTEALETPIFVATSTDRMGDSVVPPNTTMASK